MRKLIFISLIIRLLTIPEIVNAQGVDSSFVLKEQDYLELVLANHPLAKKAENLVEYGEYSVLAAKGGFDPYLFSKNKQKYYKNTNYYLLSNSGVTLPTRLGISVQAGYDWNEGEYINQENTLPETGLWYAGISVPILQGLLFDENREALQKAFVDRKYYENEAQLLLNNVLLEASNYYWTWVQKQYQKNIIEEAYEFAETNFKNYKISYEQGDKPAIDTLEAYIQLQNFSVQRQQLSNELESARLTLFTYLWEESISPLEEQSLRAPSFENISISHLDSLRTNLPLFVEDHPELRKYDLKINKLQVENRMKREKLKPKLDLSYNILQTPSSSFSEIRGLDNYNWGLSFSFPLFLRSERGALKMNNIKLENTNYEYQQKRLSIKNKARQYEFAFKNITDQLNTYESVVSQYEQLLRAELRKFEIGESSIFLINYRQLSLVNAEMKLIELKAKYNMYYRQWLHSLGAQPTLWLAQ